MLECHVFVATSVDGFIARRDGDVDWLARHPGDGDNGYAAFIARMDGIVMGRRTYEIVRNFGGDWPYALPVVVLSRTLRQQDLPAGLADRVTVRSEAPVELAGQLHGEGWRHAYVDGGAVIRSFLAAGLIRDLALFRIPVLLGEGIPLFGEPGLEIDLELTGTEVLPGGLLRTDYRVPA